jgi:hypothetical protein
MEDIFSLSHLSQIYPSSKMLILLTVLSIKVLWGAVFPLCFNLESFMRNVFWLLQLALWFTKWSIKSIYILSWINPASSLASALSEYCQRSCHLVTLLLKRCYWLWSLLLISYCSATFLRSYGLDKQWQVQTLKSVIFPLNQAYFYYLNLMFIGEKMHYFYFYLFCLYIIWKCTIHMTSDCPPERFLIQAKSPVLSELLTVCWDLNSYIQWVFP